MADEIDENDESALALDIIDGRKCLNTKNQYRLKVDHFRKWLEAKHPDCLRLDTTINLTKVDKVILKEFLGHACKKKEKDGIQSSIMRFSMSADINQQSRITTLIWRLIFLRTF